MNPERYKRIDQVFQQALGQPRESLDSFLEQACGDDKELRREVESLIEHERQAGSFVVDSPVPGPIAADQEEGSGADFSGRTLLHYRILEKIGRAGWESSAGPRTLI